jgi:hypothetical protein
MKAILKMISFIAGCFIILLMAIASNSKWMGECQEYFPNPYRYGDLYLLSTMPGFRTKGEPDPVPSGKPKNENVVLTIVGDSYTGGFSPDFFAAGTYHFIPWDQIPKKIILDQTKKNILIMECTERNVRWRFLNTNILSIGKDPVSLEEDDGSHINLAAEDNLQFMLTHLEWELPLKELKTNIYLNWFGKFSSMVDKPDGSGRLFLSETVDPQNPNSSFSTVGDDEIKKIVDCMNKEYDDLRAMGFDEVYISLVPNSSSLYKKYPLPYNHLIERVEQNPERKFPYIDVYGIFNQKKTHQSLYHINDSHWNTSGKKIWLAKVDSVLDKQK